MNQNPSMVYSIFFSHPASGNTASTYNKGTWGTHEQARKNYPVKEWQLSTIHQQKTVTTYSDGLSTLLPLLAALINSSLAKSLCQ